MSNTTTAPAASIQLQSVGLVPATPAGELKPGDVTVWNFGFTETILSVVKETAKSVVLEIRSDKEGTVHTRRFLKTRLVATK